MNAKTEIYVKWETGFYITFATPRANSPLCPPSVTAMIYYYIIFTHTKVPLLNCNKIRAGGVA